MKKSFFPIALLLLLFASFCSAADDSWMDFDEGLAKAKKDKKPIIVDFYTDWCHWCKVMDEKTFQEKSVAQKLKASFITVRINAEDREASATFKGQTFNHVQLTQAFGVSGYPTIAFLEEDGDIITTIPGYVPAENFIHILSYIEQKMYEQKMPFDEFLKLQEKSN